jgi:GDPmannose 4,6-dehydratase
MARLGRAVAKDRLIQHWQELVRRGPKRINLMHRKRAFIAGILGQDGSSLAKCLHVKGYEIQAIPRRTSSFFNGCIEHILERLNLHFTDMTDSIRLLNPLQKVRPQEVYNLTA